VDKEQLLAFYKIGNFESVKQFLELVADRRGIKAKVSQSHFPCRVYTGLVEEGNTG